MSATIYIRNAGDGDLTPDQLELLHRYSDQARVWAHLLLVEAGLIRTDEEWHSRREEWKALRDKLKALDAAFGDAVLLAIQQNYKEKKPAKDAPLPAAKNFFPEGDSRIAEADALAEQIRKDFADLYPTRAEVGYTGPFLSREEQTELFLPPDITGLSEEEASKKIKEWQDKSGLTIEKWQQSGQSPILDMVKGFVKNRGMSVVDPDTGAYAYDAASKSFNESLIEEFASEVLMRAIESYNPYRAEDTGGGYEGRKASFGTYLYRVMLNEIKSRKEQYARNLGVRDLLPQNADIPYIVKQLLRVLKIEPEELKEKVEEAGLTENSPIEAWRDFYNQATGAGEKFRPVKIPLSLSQPTGGEESLNLEETIAEKGRQEDLVDWEGLIEPLREKLYQRVSASGGRFSEESAERMVTIYRRLFIDGHRTADIARELGFVTDRPRAKEISVMKTLGIDVSSLPKTLPPEKPLTQDREERQRLWVNYFSQLHRQLDDAKQQNDDAKAKDALDKIKKGKEALDKLSAPNVGRVHNLIWGDPRPGNEGVAALIPLLTQISPEVAELVKEQKSLRKKQALEEFLTSISLLRATGGLNYTLLRNKIQQRLSKENPQLFTVYTYLYESDYSNPDTARMMRLSPPRITGLKKKIVSTLLELPEIQNFLHEGETGSTSPLRRLIYNEGDTVKVSSINETGIISKIASDWYIVSLDNGNEIYTIKEDIHKHSSLIDSAHNVLSHYFGRDIMTPQCYLSMIHGTIPKLAILELRPSSETTTTARLHINNSLVDITEFSEEYPDNLFSILKGHIGVSAQLETPFTALFDEVE